MKILDCLFKAKSRLRKATDSFAGSRYLALIQRKKAFANRVVTMITMFNMVITSSHKIFRPGIQC